MHHQRLDEKVVFRVDTFPILGNAIAIYKYYVFLMTIVMFTTEYILVKLKFDRYRQGPTKFLAPLQKNRKIP